MSIDKQVDEQYLAASQATLHVKIGDVDETDTTNGFPRRDTVIMPLGGSYHEHTIGMTDESVADALLVNNNKAKEDTEIELECGHRDESNNHILVMGPKPKEISPRRRQVDLVSVVADEKGNKMKETTSFPPLEKLESTDENDLQTLIGDNACPVASKTIALECGDGIRNISRKGKEIIPADRNVLLERSPSCSKVHINQREGKRKALSDGDDEEKMPNEEHSHESIESCNSAGFFVTSKEQRNFEQQLIDGSKRLKSQIQDSSDSRSSVKHDSSFVKWISNMTKGFRKSKEDASSSLTLTLAIPNQAHESPDQKLILCTEDRDPRFRNMGFQSIFRSMYCSYTKINETIMLDADYDTREDFNKVELDNMICDSNATPIACHGVSGSLREQFMQSNVNLGGSIAANEAGPSNKPRGLSSLFSTVQKSHDTDSADNKSDCNLVFDKENHGASLNSSTDELKRRTAEKIDSVLPSKPKTDDNFGHINDPLRSVWLERFYPKNGRSSRELVQRNQSMDSTNVDATTGFSQIRDHAIQKKVSPISLFQKLESSEVVSSTLARRVGTLKHVLPLDKKCYGDQACTHCLFCGKIGHNLQDCHQIAEIEVEDLLRSIDSYDGAEQLPCVCIRCFQIDHWAAECPSASSRGQQKFEGGTSVHHVTSQMDLNTYKQNPKLLDCEDRQLQAAGACKINDGPNLIVRSHHSLKPKLNEAMNPKMGFIPSRCGTDNAKKMTTSKKSSDIPKEIFDAVKNAKKMTTSKKSSDIPKEIFDAVKRLRLARSDILKWMSSRKLLSYLNGFFVRLRLRQWEEGLGGTGYYVARITEKQSERSAQNDKTLISVDIGGIKCTVESQVVSNQDFLEDEIVAWYHSTTKIGCKVPTFEDLKAKFEERKTLGF